MESKTAIHDIEAERIDPDEEVNDEEGGNVDVDTPSVANLVKWLRFPQRSVRLDAIERLAALGQVGVGPLVERSETEEAESVRLAIRAALTRLGVSPENLSRL